METKREGIFLRSTTRKAPSTAEPILYLMADAYSNLGYFLGSELSLPAKKRFGPLLFSLGLGFSRDVMSGSGVNGFTPFDYDGTDSWHYSRLLNYDIPFPLRYRINTSGSVSTSGKIARSANFSWSLPLQSDPYMENDFINTRSMDSNIFDLLKTASKVDSTRNDTYVSSYNWQLNGGLSFATTPLNPYVSDLSITSASMSVRFDTLPTTNPAPAANLSVPPNQRFFYPSQFTLFNINASIGGTPLSLGGSTQKKTEKDTEEIAWGEPFSPWEKDEAEKKENSEDPLVLRPSSFTRSSSSTLLGGHQFNLSYKITPSVSSEVKFNSNGWKNQNDVDWSDWAHQVLTYKVEGNISMALSEKRSLYTHRLDFNATKSGQNYLYLNEDASDYDTESERDAATKSSKERTYFRSTATYNFTLMPFFQSAVWKSTSFTYRLVGLIFEQKYDKNKDADITEWGNWTQEKITTNSFSASINANVMDKTQSFTLTADLPPKNYDEEKTTTPKVPTITGNLILNAWISQTVISSGVRDPFDMPLYDPINFTERLTYGKASLTHTMQYIPENRTDNPINPNPDKPGFRTITTTLSWGGFSASFRAARSKSYYLDTTEGQTGWKLSNNEEELNPQSLSMSYRINKSFAKWKNFSGSVNLSTSLSFNLQQYTESKFDFTLSTTLKITDFLDITLSSTSDNKQIYRYFRNLPFFDPLDVDIPGETNVFLDLFNSFRFDDIEKRRASGFKLRSFNLDLVHHLGDWDATLNVKLFPELNRATRVYEFKTTLGFIVKWTPIKEFKTDIQYSTKDGLLLN